LEGIMTRKAKRRSGEPPIVNYTPISRTSDFVATITAEGLGNMPRGFVVEGRAALPSEPTSKSYTPAELREEIGVSDTTLRKYVELAGIRRKPRRGRSRFRYTAAQRRDVLTAFAEHSPEVKLQARCRRLLGMENRK